MLKIGDNIICVKAQEDLTYGKSYKVTKRRVIKNKPDICIIDDDGHDWWFGDVGNTEPWTMWFVREIQILRENKINEILNDRL